jgi:adenosylcobinamide amidohydrolase
MTRPASVPSWKISPLLSAPTFAAYRHGRFIIAELNGKHLVVTTSAGSGGMTPDITHLVNHQSCEGSEHAERYAEISKLGPDGYQRSVCSEIGLVPETTAVMGTAANMIYAAHETASFEDLQVSAIVTAGVEGNASCAGDPARWVESGAGWQKLTEVAGTINTMVIINQPLRPEALIRSLMTTTEGKSAALMELGISSRYSQDLATGTGTDQSCIAAPIIEGRYALSSASPHSKLGELLGRTVRTATKQALRWQNGLEPSLTRSLFHALRRFGFTEAGFMQAMRIRVSEVSLNLLEKNRNAILYEPQIAAAAYAFGAVLDRVRYGVLPESAARDILRQHAATIAVSASVRHGDWHAYWERLDPDLDRPLEVVYDAIAHGWTAKWRSMD